MQNDETHPNKKAFTASRRRILQSGTAVLALAGCAPATVQDAIASSDFAFDWNIIPDRIFLGETMWANPMEDWIVKDGKAVTRTAGGKRNIQLLTHQLTEGAAAFEMKTTVSRVAMKGKKDGGAGFRVGVRSDINEYRANSFAKNGLFAGVQNDELILGKARAALSGSIAAGPIVLTLTGSGGGAPTLTLSAQTEDGTPLGTVTQSVKPKDLLGNVALVVNHTVSDKKEAKSKYAFHNWSASGPAFSVNADRRFGPIMWTMYAISDSRTDEGHVFKMNVLCAPMGPKDRKDVELFVKDGGKWGSLGRADLDDDGRAAIFRISNWDASKDYPFRVEYKSALKDGSFVTHDWTGNIRSEPKGRPLRLAALTCQKDYGFPYEPVARNVAALDPDLVYFSGDQLYENHGGFGVIREPNDLSILCYLRKYYQHGWSFRDVMRNSPTLCIPDDHDVFHGNFWGEGGEAMKDKYRDLKEATSQYGGYRQSVQMVNTVHRTNVGHHPDPFDPAPAKRDMSVYYGDMVWGNVGFAIIGDRQFKSSPEHVNTGEGRLDHIPDPDFDTLSIDKPGLTMLGERQEEFLTQWRTDWRGHEMKVLLSQTLFANTSTHHGRDRMYLKGDLDSGGWPQTARNRALDIIRPSKCLHVNGDQHLTTLVQYGVKEQRDSTWSFCTPAIAAGYPRSWLPDEMGMPHTDRPAHGIDNTGAYRDGFENLVYVYAVGNPEDQSLKNRYQIAHQKASGFGFVVIDTKAKTYGINSYRFLINLKDPAEKTQFPGWPVILTMDGEIAG